MEEVLSNPCTLPGPHPEGPGLSWGGLWRAPPPPTGGPNGAGGQGGGVERSLEMLSFQSAGMQREEGGSQGPGGEGRRDSRTDPHILKLHSELDRILVVLNILISV